jgi:hypothetical protein
VIVDFSRLSANLEPDFTLWRTGEGEAGKWTIVADPTAVNGQALGQLSNDRTDYRFPLAIYKPYSGKDLELSVRFKAVAGTVDEAAASSCVCQRPMITTSPARTRWKTMCASIGSLKAGANSWLAPTSRSRPINGTC